MNMLKKNCTSICPKCSRKPYASRLFKDTIKFIETNFNFVKEYSLPECKHKKVLSFDYAIFDDFGNLIKLIELQGRQHFANCFGDETVFKNQQLRDNIKKEFCDKHKINLITIRYDLTVKEQLDLLNDQ